MQISPSFILTRASPAALILLIKHRLYCLFSGLEKFGRVCLKPTLKVWRRIVNCTFVANKSLHQHGNVFHVSLSNSVRNVAAKEVSARPDSIFRRRITCRCRYRNLRPDRQIWLSSDSYWFFSGSLGCWRCYRAPVMYIEHWSSGWFPQWFFGVVEGLNRGNKTIWKAPPAKFWHRRTHGFQNQFFFRLTLLDCSSTTILYSAMASKAYSTHGKKSIW